MKKLILLATVLFAGCEDSPTPILGCEPVGSIIPDCRFQNPEDMAVVPSGGQLIVSQSESL